MPEEFTIDVEQRVVWARSWGELSDADIANHQERLRADPRFQPTFSQLVDCTGVTQVTLSAQTVLRMGRSTIFAPEAKRAYVVARDVMYGLVRMYELYQGLRGHNVVRVFRRRTEALAWLGVSDPLPGPVQG